MLRSDDHDGEIGALTIALSPFDSKDGGKIALTVPAKPESVRVVRAVMRTWAATVGFLLDEIEELCLAVDEAFAGLIAARPAPTCVIVRIRKEGDAVDITAVRDAPAELWPPVSAQTALVRRVLTTLIDEVHFEQTDEGPAIHMVKRRAPVSAPPHA